MRLIVTRPRHDGESLAHRLAAHGHEAIRAPLIEIVYRLHPPIPGEAFQAVALSSANAARAIADHSAVERLRAIPAFAVGEQSAEAARQAGFADVNSAGGDASDLASLLGVRLNPADGPILYLSGADVAADLAGTLGKAGFAVNRVVLYDARALTILPPDIAQVIRDETADGVLLYSPRTAAIWRKLLDQAGLAPGRLVHYCLSANVAAALAPTYKVAVADRPTEASLLALLGRASNGGR